MAENHDFSSILSHRALFLKIPKYQDEKIELEKKWFNLLISVQGVGAKAAIAILSSITIDELGYAISNSEKYIFILFLTGFSCPQKPHLSVLIFSKVSAVTLS